MRHLGEIAGRPYPAFDDRAGAGRRLADFLAGEGAEPDAVIGVPGGGVAVARPVARAFEAPMGVVLVRKLPYPRNPEAGFGAVTLDGEVVLNRSAAALAGLGDEQIEKIVNEVLESLKERAERFAGVREPVPLEGRDVVVVDDGLATGVTMQAALGELRGKEPRALAVAVPDAPMGTIEKIEPLVDQLYCLVAQRGGSFAVASYYRRWRDLTDAEAVAILREAVAENSPGSS